MRLTEFYRVSGFVALTVAFGCTVTASVLKGTAMYVRCAMLSSNEAPLYNELSELLTCIHIEMIITSLIKKKFLCMDSRMHEKPSRKVQTKINDF